VGRAQVFESGNVDPSTLVTVTLVPGAPQQPAPAPFLVSIGNIHATQHHAVTPGGTWPIADVNTYLQSLIGQERHRLTR